jgi:hypothetical protein
MTTTGVGTVPTNAPAKELPPLPPNVKQLLDDTALALRISLMEGRTPRKLRISFTTWPDGTFSLEQTWRKPKAVAS